MSEYAVEFNRVWKKFARGERFDSLRDLIPSMAKAVFSRRRSDELQAKEFWALKDVSFQLERGEAIALIGPNGSGKSTTLKLLSNILRPTRGHLKVNGRLGTLIELGAGFHPDLTGRENIYLNGTILGMNRAEINSRLDDIIEFSELREFLDTPVKRYSSGMFARLGFSVAVHIDPEILIVDEVLSVGDYHFQQRCFDKMKEFIARGTSLVFVSHNMNAVGTLCKRALLLRKGEVAYHGDVSAAIALYHSFHEQDTKSEHIEIIGVRLCTQSGHETEILDPGERIVLTVELRALRDLQDAHAAVLIHTEEGQFVFDTATSRLLERQRLNLKTGQSARVSFFFDMNLRGGIFLIGFTVTSEIEVTGQFYYYNVCLKRVVMRGDLRSNGFIFLNPRAEMVIE
jgi:lipopolysaccharide transport system ATP-binding protein